MTYVHWHGPERSGPAATVSKPPADLKALAKQCAGQHQEVEYTADELLANARIYGARRHRELGQTE